MNATDSNPNQRPNVVLYTRRGCHLCEDAHQLLVEHGLQPQLVDIDDDPELRNAYDTSVPVVEIDGKIRFRGRIDPRLLRRLTAAASMTRDLQAANRL